MGELVQPRQAKCRALRTVMAHLSVLRGSEAIACESVCDGALKSDKILMEGP